MITPQGSSDAMSLLEVLVSLFTLRDDRQNMSDRLNQTKLTSERGQEGSHRQSERDKQEKGLRTTRP